MHRTVLQIHHIPQQGKQANLPNHASQVIASKTFCHSRVNCTEIAPNFRFVATFRSVRPALAALTFLLSLLVVVVA